MINIGLIGVGGIGTYQAKAFSRVDTCKIVAAADLSEKARANFTATYPGVTVYEDHKQLLRDKSVDAVCIAVPTHLHRQVASDALKAGRPVLLEKPMARTVADCRKLIATASKARKLLMIAHCRRYDQDWGTFAKLIRDGAIGGPVLWRHCTAANPTFPAWFMEDDKGGGPLIDGAVHNYDFANLLFGEPQSVIASAIKLKDCTATDTGTAVVRYKSGHQLMVCWSWATPGAGMHDCLGPKGSIRFGPGDMKPEQTDGYAFYNVTDLQGKGRLISFKYDFLKMYEDQARHFVDCIENKTPCRSPGKEAIKAVAVAEAILKAGQSGAARRVTW